MARMGNLFHQVIDKANLSKEDIGAIGIGVPGVLDIDRGVVLFLPNLPGTWPDVPLGETIEHLTGLPVFILNDVRSITYGEWRFGAGRGFSTIACFAIGTGIGGGLVINSRLHLGFGGTAGELGHQIIDFNGPKCGCGNYGCLEAYASGPAIAAMGMKAVAQGLTTSIAEQVGGDLNSITPAIIASAAESGDEIAKEIYESAGYYIGIAMTNVMVSVSPQRIILSGGVANAGNLLIDPICRTLEGACESRADGSNESCARKTGRPGGRNRCGIVGGGAFYRRLNRLEAHIPMYFEVGIWIDRTPELVFNFLRDIDQHPQEPGSPVIAYDKVTDGPASVGTRYQEVIRVGPIGNMQIISTLTHFAPPIRLEMDWDSGGMYGHLAYHLHIENGGTRLKQKETLYPRGLWVLMTPFLRLFFERILQNRLGDIKRQLEGGQ